MVEDASTRGAAASTKAAAGKRESESLCIYGSDGGGGHQWG
uniref:Uncharacterized protein n=1 Tax=Arundo donax TaxID=35708 RepID=A0A0A9A5J1_ARUDO